MTLQPEVIIAKKGLKIPFYLSHTIPGLFYHLPVSLVYIPLAELHFQLVPLIPLEHWKIINVHWLHLAFLDWFLGCKRSTYTRVNTVDWSNWPQKIKLWKSYRIIPCFWSKGWQINCVLVMTYKRPFAGLSHTSLISVPCWDTIPLKNTFFHKQKHCSPR